MAELAETPQLDNDLADSLRRTLQSFFDETTGIDREYLTRAATDLRISYEGCGRFIEFKIQCLIRRAAMSLIKRVGKIMSSLPEAIKQTLQLVEFNSEAPPMRDLPEDEAEFEEDMEQDVAEESPGLPASGTPSRSSTSVEPERKSFHHPYG